MKQKLLNISVAVLVTGVVFDAHAFGMPSFSAAGWNNGIGVIGHTTHVFPACVLAPPPGGPLCAGAMAGGSDWLTLGTTMWLDWALAGATALDYASSLFQGDRTIDAKDAISQLEEALEGGSGGGSSGGGGTSGDSSLAAAYTADQVMAQIEVTKVSADQMFANTRKAIQEYLFESPDATIKGECDLDDKSCATQRQNEWLLASVTLASATADKVLDMTAKQNVKDGQTEAEKSEDEQKEGETKTTGGGSTTLTAHFKKLASNFNAETSPTGLYNRMADIVLDTHRQINDANALLGRDLEAAGLRIINETGPVLMDGSEEEE